MIDQSGLLRSFTDGDAGSGRLRLFNMPRHRKKMLSLEDDSRRKKQLAMTSYGLNILND